MYIIDGWKIVGRQYYDGAERNTYDLYEMILKIDKAQPTMEQLGEEKIKELLEKE